MPDNERLAMPNYEALYEAAKNELAKEKMTNELLSEDLRNKERQLAFYNGIKQTLEVICGREFHNA